MKTKPIVLDPNIPGPGNYPVQSFVDKIKKDPKPFTLFKK